MVTNIVLILSLSFTSCLTHVFFFTNFWRPQLIEEYSAVYCAWRGFSRFEFESNVITVQCSLSLSLSFSHSHTHYAHSHSTHTHTHTHAHMPNSLMHTSLSLVHTSLSKACTCVRKHTHIHFLCLWKLKWHFRKTEIRQLFPHAQLNNF